MKKPEHHPLEESSEATRSGPMEGEANCGPAARWWIRCPKCSLPYAENVYFCPHCGATHPSIQSSLLPRRRHVPLRFAEDEKDDTEICDDLHDTHSKLSERGYL